MKRRHLVSVSMARRVPREEQLPLPPIPRDWRMTTAAICVGVSLAGLIVSVILAVVLP